MALTKQQKAEFLRCKKDPVYFIKNYIYITTEDQGIIKFDLWDYQVDIINDIIYNNSENLYHIRKSRQVGISTLMSAVAVWLCNFHNSKNVAIISYNLKTAQKLHEKTVFAWENLPDWMRMGKKKKNTKVLKLKNQSSIEAFPFRKDHGTRSISASLIVLDECAFIPDAEELFKAVKPSAEHGKIVALSSPNGPQGWFYDVYQKTKRGEMTFKLIKLDWSVHPNRDQEWRDRQDKEMGKRSARQEYDAHFGYASDTFIDPDFIEFIEENSITEPIKKMWRDKFWIWEEAIAGETYMVVVDPTGGETKKSDFGCVQVIRISTWTQVAEYLEKIHYDKFNYKAIQIAQMYNNALLVIEDNSIGKTTMSRAKDLGYVNLYRRGSNQKEQKILNLKKSREGWNTNTRTRPLMMSSLRQMLETYEGYLKIQSSRSLDQLRTFSDVTVKARSGAHDDCILPLSIGCIVYEMNTFTFENPTGAMDMLDMMAHGSNIAKKNFEKIKEHEEEIKDLTDEQLEEYNLKKKRKEILKKNRLYHPELNTREGNLYDTFSWVYK